MSKVLIKVYEQIIESRVDEIICLNNIQKNRIRKFVYHFNSPKHILAFKTDHLKLKTLCICNNKKVGKKHFIY